MMASQYLTDAGIAVPAAVSRILLGMRTEPKAGLVATVLQKVSALLGALFFALMAGQIAREFAQTKDYATLIIICAAFTAQDAAITLIKRSKAKLKDYEREM